VLELLLMPRIYDLSVQLQVANIGALRALDVIENLGARKITIKCEVSGNSTRDGVVDQVHAQDGVVFKRALHTSIPLLETAPLDGIVRPRGTDIVRDYIIMGNHMALIGMIPEPPHILDQLALMRHQ